MNITINKKFDYRCTINTYCNKKSYGYKSNNHGSGFFFELDENNDLFLDTTLSYKDLNDSGFFIDLRVNPDLQVYAMPGQPTPLFKTHHLTGDALRGGWSFSTLLPIQRVVVYDKISKSFSYMNSHKSDQVNFNIYAFVCAKDENYLSWYINTLNSIKKEDGMLKITKVYRDSTKQHTEIYCVPYFNSLGHLAHQYGIIMARGKPKSFDNNVDIKTNSFLQQVNYNIR